MDTDNLKSAWQSFSSSKKSKEELNLIMKNNTHPVLASIKKQLIIELLGFFILLVCYFSMFDGGSKPLAINLVMIVAILLQLFYGYRAYLMQSEFKSSTNLYNDLKNFINKLKMYRSGVVTARVLFALALITFFTYNINFSANKFWTLAFIILIFSTQLGFLYHIWSKRITKLEIVWQEFSRSAY